MTIKYNPVPSPVQVPGPFVARAYKTVFCLDQGTFDQRVNNMLEHGWMLFGGPATSVESHVDMFLQALVHAQPLSDDCHTWLRTEVVDPASA